MADRSVVVRLKAQTDEYIQGMNAAAEATRETGSEAEKLSNQRQAFEMLGASALAMGVAAAAGAALAVSKWADFDQAMSNVQAAAHESEENMKLLSDAALDAGARTVFSAEESANAIEELAKAGVSTADILNGALDGALDLAAAGGLGVADAAGIAATALKTFNLEGADMAHVADLLAAGAGKAMGDVTDLSAALNQSAMVANASGLSIEETTGALSAFASQGLLGSDAGTSFKAMLQSLTPTSAKARDTMDELGITAYDAQGSFVGLAEFAGSLEAGLKDLSVEQQQSALKTIFGSDAIRAATVLYSEGADGIREWIDAVDDQGYAAETAAARLDNLKGDIEALGGALDTALIQTGSAANDAMRGAVQWITSLVDAYTDLPPELQSVALWTGIVVAAIGILGGGFLLAVPKIAEFKAALTTLEITSGRVASSIAAIAPAAIALAAIPIAAKLTQWIDDLRATTMSAESLEKQLRLTGATASEIERGLTGGSPFRGIGMDSEIAANNLRQLNTSVGQMKAWFDNTMLGQAMSAPFLGLGREAGNTQKQIEELDAAMAALFVSGDVGAASDAYNYFAEKAKEAGWSVERIAEALPEYTAAVESSIPHTQTSADRAAGAASAYLEQADAARAASDELLNLIDALMESNSVAQTAEGANERYQSTLDEVRQAMQAVQDGVEGASGSLDRNTVQGAANRAMFANLAADSQRSAQAYFEMETATLGAEEAAKNHHQRLTEGRDALIDLASATGASTDEVMELVDALYEVPGDYEAIVVANTHPARAELESLLGSYRNSVIPVTVQMNADLYALHAAGMLADGGMIAYANGGMHEFAAGGGVNTGIYSGGTPIIKFAEPETGWEAFISGKAGQEARNRQVWVDAGERLGVMQEMRDLVTAAVSRGPAVTIKQDIHPQPQQSEAEIGAVAARKIAFAMRSA